MYIHLFICTHLFRFFLFILISHSSLVTAFVISSNAARIYGISVYIFFCLFFFSSMPLFLFLLFIIIIIRMFSGECFTVCCYKRIYVNENRENEYIHIETGGKRRRKSRKCWLKAKKKVLRNCYVDQMAHKVGGFSYFM